MSIKIFIDPGHGGSDRANKGPTGYVEADGVLKISLLLEKELLATGAFTVGMSRRTDATVGLSARGKAAVNFGADLFISEHTNAGSSDARGTEVYYSVDIPGDKSLAASMSKAVSSALGIPDRGAKVRESQNYPGEDYYTVIDIAQDGRIPHVLLVESAFHSNPQEEKLLKDEACLQKIAQAQAKVICDFFGVTSVEALEAALAKLSPKIITTTAYWKANAVPGKKVDGAYIQAVIRKYVSMFKKCNSYADMVQYLVTAGIISDPNYWKTNAIPGKTVDGGFAQTVLVRMANKL
ncbi:N-acetylmuramoyl-L-alanine amidase [Biomaibacter acetigenes]|uniref:N-acetylmuramoyl-L-alanine amidase n=1 Tax=Biomaibacter acetigenes TaxID=2316383 RepID=A0A3G2R5D0_9FIRM|nr:N-acetylmuramoyl-L-alanine amidase [Biomaibacter acetigenes]AYO30581.1 N-acetylmuramoyl-L-alanine amidase [Biomaibacter acetigenes]